MKLSIIFTIIVLFLLFPEGSTAQTKKKFTPKDLPAAVSTAFQKSYPQAKITGADKEVEQGKTMYEVESMDGKIRRDLMYLEDGTVFETEEVVSAKSLPQAVSGAVAKEFPKSEIEKAEKLVRGTTTEYELQIEQGKKMYAVVVSDQGVISKKKEMKPKKQKKEKDDDDEEKED